MNFHAAAAATGSERERNKEVHVLDIVQIHRIRGCTERDTSENVNELAAAASADVAASEARAAGTALSLYFIKLF